MSSIGYLKMKVIFSILLFLSYLAILGQEADRTPDQMTFDEILDVL